MKGGKRENAGRPKGTGNKYNLRELFEQHNFDVGTVIIEMLEDTSTDKRTKTELIKLVFPYIFARPQSFNSTLEDSNQQINVTIRKISDTFESVKTSSF